MAKKAPARSGNPAVRAAGESSSSRSSRGPLIAAIVAGVAVIAAIIVAVVLSTGGQQPASEPREPREISFGAAECDEASECFTATDLESLVPSPEVIASHGMEELEAPESESTTVAEEWEAALSIWEQVDGTPDECAFTLAPGPVLPADSGSADEMFDQGAYRLDGGLLQYARVFSSEELARQYMTNAAEAAAACSSYTVSTGTETRRELGDAREPATPSTVALGGWTEDGEAGQAATYDLQRGNLVIRVSSIGAGAGASLEGVDAYISDLADRLAALELDG